VNLKEERIIVTGKQIIAVLTVHRHKSVLVQITKKAKTALHQILDSVMEVPKKYAYEKEMVIANGNIKATVQKPTIPAQDNTN
jgi:hypothetical protein